MHDYLSWPTDAGSHRRDDFYPAVINFRITHIMKHRVKVPILGKTSKSSSRVIRSSIKVRFIDNDCKIQKEKKKFVVVCSPCR